MKSQDTQGKLNAEVAQNRLPSGRTYRLSELVGASEHQAEIDIVAWKQRESEAALVRRFWFSDDAIGIGCSAGVHAK